VSESSVIREFLVKLGFKTDEAALQNFEKGVDRATKTVIGLAAAIETTAIAVAAGVARFASNLEALYFASIRTNTAAANLQAYDLAVQNFGGSAGEATASIEGLAHALRTNPGNEGLLKGLGVDARDAKGDLRDLTDVMLELGKTFADEPLFIAEQQAQMLGINEKTLLAMRNGDFAKEVLRQRELVKNSGFKEATEDAHRFMMQLRELGVFVQAFGIRVYDALSKKLGGSMESLSQWLQTNGPMIADRVADILVKLITLAEKIGPAIGWIIDKLIELDEETGGWSTKIIAVIAALKILGGFQIINGILGIASAFGGLTTSIAGASAGATTLLGLLTRVVAVAAAGAAGYWAGGKVYENLSEESQDKIGAAVAAVLATFGNKEAQNAIAVNDPLTFLQRLGWSKDQAAGILANLQAESSMNPNAVGDHGQAYGLAQWHPDRQAAFAKWAGHDMRQSNTAEQLAFVDYELKRGAERSAGALMQAATSSRQAAEIMARNYERPANVQLAAQQRGDRAVQISQETNIHMHGVSDPKQAGAEAERRQTRVNADLTRNFAAVVN
jgi:hypothetical protein